MTEPGKTKKTDEEIVEEMREAELAKLPVWKRPCLIEDGYTIKGAVDRIIQTDELGREVAVTQYDFKFTYRPLNAAEKKAWAEVPDKEAEAYNVKMLVDRIESWNLKDAAGKQITINEINLHRLDPELEQYLLGVVLSLAGYPNQADEKYSGNVGRKIIENLAIPEKESETVTREFSDSKN